MKVSAGEWASVASTIRRIPPAPGPGRPEEKRGVAGAKPVTLMEHEARKKVARQQRF